MLSLVPTAELFKIICSIYCEKYPSSLSIPLSDLLAATPRKRFGSPIEHQIKHVLGFLLNYPPSFQQVEDFFFRITGQRFDQYFSHFYLSPSDLEYLVESSCVLGSHGMNHIRLSSSYASYQLIKRELDDSFEF